PPPDRSLPLDRPLPSDRSLPPDRSDLIWSRFSLLIVRSLPIEVSAVISQDDKTHEKDLPGQTGRSVGIASSYRLGMLFRARRRRESSVRHSWSLRLRRLSSCPPMTLSRASVAFGGLPSPFATVEACCSRASLLCA